LKQIFSLILLPVISLFEKILSAIFGTVYYQKYFNNYIARNSTFLFFMHCFGIALVFFSNYILVKAAGVNNYGSYVYLFNLVYLLVSFCVLGFDTLLVKKTAIYVDAKKYPEFKGLLFFAFRVILISSIAVALLFNVISNFSKAAGVVGKINWFAFAFISLFMLAATALTQVVLQGMRKIVWSQLGEKIFRPLILIILVLLFYFLQKSVSLEKILWINVSSIAVTMLIALIVCGKTLGGRLKKIIPVYHFKDWITASATFFIADVLYNCNSRISIFLLGLFQNEKNIGVFNITLRISEVISFSLVIVNFVLSPVIAKLYANGDTERLQQLVTRCARVTLAIGSLLTVGILFFRREILLLFGDNFLLGQQALIILCIGQLVNVISGSVGLLLLMTGNQRFSIYSLAAGITINLVLNLLLTPIYGITGAAIAATASLVVWNVMTYFFVRTKLNIRPTAFGFL
ncbi:MAG: polysaccharide biosynthesis C-terminal domain-containing protein, partial [Ginsengibacter sp.]